MPAKKTPPQEPTADQRKQIFELRRAGLSYNDISSQLGIGNRNVVRDAYLAELGLGVDEEAITELRAVESDRLDRLQRSIWGKAVAGDLRAMQSVLRIMERRAKLHGLDAAKADDDATIIVEPVHETSLDRALAKNRARRANLKAV